MASDESHPLRDPRLFSMQALPSPVPAPPLPDSALGLFLLRDPALASDSTPGSLPQPLPNPPADNAPASSLPVHAPARPTPHTQSAPDQLPAQDAKLPQPQSTQSISDPAFSVDLVSLQAAVESNTELFPPPPAPEPPSVLAPVPSEGPSAAQLGSLEQSLAENLPDNNQTTIHLSASLSGTVEPLTLQTECAATGDLTMADPQAENTSVAVPEPDQTINTEPEPATSRKRSLSLESIGNPEVALTNHTGLPADMAGSTSGQGAHQDASASPTHPSNNNSPTPMVLLKFPLPAKPTPAGNHTPLFAPSPPQETPEETRNEAPRQPLLSRLATLKQRVEKDRMDGEAWLELIADAEKKGDLEKTREVYKSFLSNFPDAANQWIAQAELELGHGHFPEVEALFKLCLQPSVSVELWACYLNYIRRVNPIEGDKASTSRALIIAAYEFSVSHIGIHRDSGQIWLDYINVLKEGEAVGTWQEQQKMDAIRKQYQRAVCIPLNYLEQLWRDYDAFEHTMSKMTAKKFLADKSAQYMAARTALREMKALTDPLHRPKVPVKPNWKRIGDHRNLEQWKAYLQWEEKNPLDLQEKAALNTRIQFAYRQAAMHMRFYCEIWYLAAHHLQKMGRTEDALLKLHAGLAANPTSMVLTYAVVEIQETLKNYSVCTDAFNTLIEHYHSEIDQINKTIEKEIAHGIPVVESKNTNGTDQEIGHELTEEEQKRAKQEEELRANVTALYKPKIDELREAAASVWITEMRFARRTEGIKPARGVFTRARKSPYLTRHVFEASAMMEYHWNKEASVATKVFDLGLKSFSEDVDYVLNYLDFLISLNDDSNARALFEKTIFKIPLEASRPLWHRWAAYEYIYGDSTASHKLDARISENFPDWTIVHRLGEKHNYSGLEDVLGRELGTSVEPIPLRRSPSPVPQHLHGYGFKHAHSREQSQNIPSGPAALQRNRQRERSFSPQFRGKRSRQQRESITPERRMGGPVDHGAGPAQRSRESHEVPKRNRFSSPPRGRETPPPSAAPRDNPYAWFPEGLRYFLSILPTAASFDGPRLDAHTVLQVLADATVPSPHTNGNGNGNSHGNGSHSGMGVVNPNHPNANRGEGFHSNTPPGWGPNRGGGSLGNPQQSRGGNGGGGRRGRRK